MKKFIAFINGSNSGIQTKERAHEWAANQLGQGRIDKIHIAEVIETVERAQPTIEVKSFFCELNEPVAKAAA